MKGIKDTLRVNREIRAREVRVIDTNGKQLGIMSLEEALRKAKEYDLDLVEVAPNAKPPVCKILDYGKYKYMMSKKAQEAKKKQSLIQIKEIKLRPKTDIHDLQVKERHIRRFLKDGAKVKVTIRFRGREITHPEIAEEILKKMHENIKDLAIIEQEPRFEGRTMTMLLSPKKGKGGGDA